MVLAQWDDVFHELNLHNHTTFELYDDTLNLSTALTLRIPSYISAQLNSSAP